MNGAGEDGLEPVFELLSNLLGDERQTIVIPDIEQSVTCQTKKGTAPLHRSR